MKPVTQEQLAIARHVADAFGRPIHVREYLHDSEALAVDILRSDDHPVAGVTSYSTIGLSDVPVPSAVGDGSMRIELVGAARREYELFPNILASTAFLVMQGEDVGDGEAVIHNYVGQYVRDSPVPHVFLTSPFLWPLRPFTSATQTILWLQLVPVSESESAYARARGGAALARLLTGPGVDVYDLHRAPVV